MSRSQRRPLIISVLGAAGVLTALLFFMAVTDTHNRYVSSDESVIILAILAINTACWWGLAALRLHRDWHPGRLVLLGAFGLMLMLAIDAHLAGLPVVTAAILLTWYWLPNRKQA